LGEHEQQLVAYAKACVELVHGYKCIEYCTSPQQSEVRTQYWAASEDVSNQNRMSGSLFTR